MNACLHNPRLYGHHPGCGEFSDRPPCLMNASAGFGGATYNMPNNPTALMNQPLGAGGSTPIYVQNATILAGNNGLNTAGRGINPLGNALTGINNRLNSLSNSLAAVYQDVNKINNASGLVNSSGLNFINNQSALPTTMNPLYNSLPSINTGINASSPLPGTSGNAIGILSV